jgi:SAM-dependent methyltransferase
MKSDERIDAARQPAPDADRAEANRAAPPNAGRAPDQRAYWDANLDVGNLGREAPAIDVEKERRFFLASPELRWALREMRPASDASAGARNAAANTDAITTASHSRGGELSGLRVADIGAGLGVASLLLAERGARPELVDLAPSRLQAAGAMLESRGFGGRFGLHVAKAEELPFDDASLDRLFTRSVLIHTDLAAALREARRVLKPGGVALFVEPMARNPFANLYRRFLGPSEWRTITNYFTEERVAMVRAAFAGAPEAASPLAAGSARDGASGENEEGTRASRREVLHAGAFAERRFHVLGFGAFAFQFALSSPGLFRAALALTTPLDAALMALCPPLRRLAWFTAMRVEKGEGEARAFRALGQREERREIQKFFRAADEFEPPTSNSPRLAARLAET